MGETVLPESFAEATRAKHSKGFVSSNEQGYPSSYSGDNVYDPVKIVGYVYRLKFYGNPGKLKEPEIEIYLDGKRPSILTQKGYHIITSVYTDGQQGESDDYFADHCDGVTATINRAVLNNDGTYNYNSYHYLGLSDSEIKLLKACLGGSDDDDENNIETYNWDWGNAIFPHLIKLVRSTTVYTDGGYYAALVWKNDGNFKACQTCDSSTGAFILVNPFKSLDSDGSSDSDFWYGTDLYDIYTTKGTLALTTSRTKSQTLESNRYNDKHYYGKTEAIFGFGSKEIIMTRPFGNNARAADANYDLLGDLQVNADSNSENTGSVSCEHLVNADNYYCLNKTDIFTLLAFDDGSTANAADGSLSAQFTSGAATYDDIHFMANSPYLNLYSAEKLVSDRADYAVSDLFRQHMSYLPASTGLNRITTDISTNWASSLIGATDYTYSTINGCTILQTNMTCAADQALTGKAPQVGDIVKSTTVTTKGVYIVAASGESPFPVT